jgi:undecaprenol kinase
MKLLKSFIYAGRGFIAGTEGRNMRIHLVMTVLVIYAGVFFSISLREWVILFLCIGSVISAELMNTALEEICNAVRSCNPETYEKLGKPKDLAAGAVFVLAIMSACVGLMIFWPYISGMAYRY